MLGSVSLQRYRVYLRVLLTDFLRIFKEPPEKRELLQIPIRNMFRLAEHWRYDFLTTGSSPRNDITKEEGEEVYSILDVAFKEAFPSQSSLVRSDAAVYLERIITAVHSEMIEGQVTLPGALQDLIRFLEVVLEKLEK